MHPTKTKCVRAHGVKRSETRGTDLPESRPASDYTHKLGDINLAIRNADVLLFVGYTLEITRRLRVCIGGWLVGRYRYRRENEHLRGCRWPLSLTAHHANNSSASLRDKQNPRRNCTILHIINLCARINGRWNFEQVPGIIIIVSKCFRIWYSSRIWRRLNLLRSGIQFPLMSFRH